MNGAFDVSARGFHSSLIFSVARTARDTTINPEPFRAGVPDKAVSQLITPRMWASLVILGRRNCSRYNLFLLECAAVPLSLGNLRPAIRVHFGPLRYFLRER